MTGFNSLTPLDIAAYLRATGWKATQTHGRWKIYEKDLDGEAVEIEVPTASGSSDYARLVSRLIEDIARLEDRPIDILEKDVRSSAYDIVRLRLKGNLHNGRIPIEHGAHVFHATRDLLLAAACSTIDPRRPTFARRKPQVAMDYLRSAKLAPTEAGSFVVTVETTVPPKLRPAQADLFNSEDSASEIASPLPFARSVGLMLESGTTRTRSLVDEIGASDSSDGLIESVGQGVTSNLCEAIARLIEPEVSESLEITFRWSGLWPAARPMTRLVFESTAQPLLRSMASSLREAATYDDCPVFGPVRTLKSNDVDAGGTVTLVMMGPPAKMRRVSIALDPSAYRLANQAHVSDRWFSCVGELFKFRGSYQLSNARNATILAEDDDIDELDEL